MLDPVKSHLPLMCVISTYNFGGLYLNNYEGYSQSDCRFGFLVQDYIGLYIQYVLLRTIPGVRYSQPRHGLACGGFTDSAWLFLGFSQLFWMHATDCIFGAFVVCNSGLLTNTPVALLELYIQAPKSL